MPISNETSRYNVRLLWWLRNIAILGQSFVILGVKYLLRLPLDATPLWCVIAALIAINIFTAFRLRAIKPIGEPEFFCQLLADMVCLTLLLYYTGGAANPFTSLYILQVVIAAITLPPKPAWAAAWLAIGFYTLLMFYKIDLPYINHHVGDFTLHVQGMWVNFMLLTLLLAWFVSRMSMTIRRQDMLLAEAEQIATLGTFATNAAHDLATPLATLALLAGEIAGEARGETQTRRAALFATQIKRCKDIISQITRSAGVMRAESGEVTTLPLFLGAVADRWCDSHPNATLLRHIEGIGAPAILADYGFGQAVSNLLTNAADASQAAITLDATWTKTTLTLAIGDKGEGKADDMRRFAEKPGATTKPNGMGMGLYLAKTVLARLGGTLSFTNRHSGGLEAIITLPLARLLP